MQKLIYDKRVWVAVAMILIIATGVYLFWPTVVDEVGVPAGGAGREEPEIVPSDEPIDEPTVSPEPESIVEPEPEIAYERFVVPLSATTSDSVADRLLDQGFISSKTTFNIALLSRGNFKVAPGAYRLHKEMTVFEVAGALSIEPYMKWVVIPEGLRKEEIAELFVKNLGWTEQQKNSFLTVDTVGPFPNDGVYFPDTYLIGVEDSTSAVAGKLYAKFNEKFAPYLTEANAQNIKWTVVLTMASIVQREASSDDDMPIIAGVLWNRLAEDMHLGVDATLQYARGDAGNGWWAPIKVADKEIDSPFNTYKYRGLPPHPIANPGLSAIQATLYPAETDCLYYLHDDDGGTHCAVTYEEHLDNIEEYLK